MKNIKHQESETVLCSSAQDVRFAGTLNILCTNGEVSVAGKCGKYCPPDLIISNGAPVLSMRQDHDETRE